AVANNLYVGYSAGSRGTYNLSGNGTLLAFYESIGVGGPGIFNQTGGTNTLGINGNGNVSINSGYYLLSGGFLNGTQPGYILMNGGGMQASGGTLDGSGFATITAGSSSLLDLTGSILSAGSISVTVAANSLLILPSASSTSSFSNLSNAGLTDILGTT